MKRIPDSVFRQERERCHRNAQLCRQTAEYASRGLRFQLARNCEREALDWDRRCKRADDMWDCVLRSH